MTDPVTLESAVKEYQARLKLHRPALEADNSAPEAPFSKAAPHFSRIESRASNAETVSCEKEDRSFECGNRTNGIEARALRPSVDVSKPLAERLYDLFGGGDNPSLRRALYLRIQLTCLKFGKPAEDVLAATVDYALHARRPGNCFAFTILRRLREAGLTQEV
jgi:hypothetical protein